MLTKGFLSSICLLITLSIFLARRTARKQRHHGEPGGVESTQVNDPRPPENEPYLKRHEEWWDAIVQMRMDAGASCFTFDPEFGPYPYMPSLSFAS